MVDIFGFGVNVLILGVGGLGKIIVLQIFICLVVLIYILQQVQFYCLVYSSIVLIMVFCIFYVGEVVGFIDFYGVCWMVVELLVLVCECKCSFLECGIVLMEMFWCCKFGGEVGLVFDDGFGDVYLVIDNYWVLVEENEVLIEQVNVIINQGFLFGVYVVVIVDCELELWLLVCSGFGFCIELCLVVVEDVKLVCF